MRSSSRAATRSGPEPAPSPSPGTSALRRHGGFDASEHYRSLRQTDPSRAAGYDWSGASPPSTPTAMCASTTRSPPPTRRDNAPSSRLSSAACCTYQTHSATQQQTSSNDSMSPTAQAVGRQTRRARRSTHNHERDERRAVGGQNRLRTDAAGLPREEFGSVLLPISIGANSPRSPRLCGRRMQPVPRLSPARGR
jgi:hypothetical protein